MAKYKAYPEYKDSGVEWLGEVPITWSIFKLKFGLSEPLVYGANEAALDDNPNNPRYIRITDMNPDGTLRRDTFKSLPKMIAEPYMLIDGDILLARSGATVGKSFYYRSIFGASCFAGYLIRARFNREKIIPRLAYWFCQSSIYWQYISGSQIQATIQNVSAEKYSDLYLSAPLEYAEQVRVVNFLDHETAKIDNLIEKQQQLIELLKEKRQAVISHAVTKGLNPDVPMKDSGVEWLGEVPEHWDVPKLLHVTRTIGDGLHSTPEYDNETGYYFINGNNLVNGKISIGATAKEVSKSEYNKHYVHLDEASVLLSINGTIGNVAVYNNERVILGKSAAYVKCGDKLNVNYLMCYFITDEARYYFDLEVTGTTIFNLSLNSIRQMKVCIPPLEEQKLIIDYCFAQENKYNYLIHSADTAIKLMQERRTALISAAVTGKIDVRGWVAPNVCDAEVSQEATA